METINSLNSEVLVGENCLNKLQNVLFERYDQKQVYVLCDENTIEHCWPILLNSCPELKEAELIEIESGEENKNIETVVSIWQLLTEFKVRRNALIINLGGGVIGDMGGFIASTYKRGIDFINVPTTLLSMVDATVGGKLGIDFEGAKNQIGLFKSPNNIYVNPTFLETLNPRELLSGFAEIIKHGLILDQNYWNEIKRTQLNSSSISTLIPHSIRLKSRVVSNDFTEKGERKLLNFGHTIGHAVESFFLDNNTPILHGEAVVIGMICETYLSFKILDLNKGILEEIVSYLVSIYPTITWDESINNTLLENMKQDKKNINDEVVNFTLIKNIGEGVWDQEVNTEMILESLNYYLSL